MKYPIQRIEVVDKYEADDTKSMAANNTSAFNYRLIAGTNKLSNHGKGYKNRNVKTCKGKYAKYMIHKNDKVYKIFKKYGFSWGGDWNSLKDYQHFEYTG